MKNILHYANYQATYKGNFIESLRQLTARLKEISVETIYAFPAVTKNSKPDIWMNELRTDGNLVFNFTNTILDDAKLIRKIIKTYDIGIIHVHFFTMKQMLSIKLGVLGTNVRIIMHFHNHSMQANGFKSYFRQIFYKNDAMVGCSDSVFESIKRDYPKNKVYAVDNGVKFDRLNEFTIIDRSEYGLRSDSHTLLMFGFDYFRKGVDIAIDAVKKLNDKHGNYELIVSLSKNRDIIIEEIIKVSGEVPHFVTLIDSRSDVASLYNMCDIFISPSREEGLPYSVIEASYCNCSIVISDIPPQKCLCKIPHIVYHKSGNSDSLTSAIEYAMSRRHDKIKDVENIRSFILKNYSLDKWANSIIDIYNKAW